MNEPYLITDQGTLGTGREMVFTPSLTLIFNGIDPWDLGAASEDVFTPTQLKSDNENNKKTSLTDGIVS